MRSIASRMPHVACASVCERVRASESEHVSYLTQGAGCARRARLGPLVTRRQPRYGSTRPLSSCVCHVSWVGGWVSACNWMRFSKFRVRSVF
jgi:hypothetical protein